MDIKGVLTIFTEHSDKAIGTSLALIFLTGMALLVRSLGDKSENQDHGGHGPAIDIDVIEDAMKRVLATQPVSVIAGSSASGEVPLSIAAGSSGDGEALARLNQAVQEREARIQKLGRELDDARTALERAQATSGDSGGASAEEVAGLKSKLDELQARLAEYEIIEDDIADLSLFKEENSRLKAELEALRAAGATIAPPPQAAAAASVSAPTPAPAAQPAAEAKSDRFELDFNDDVMKEFAAAVEVQRAPPPENAKSIPAGMMPALDPQAAIDAMFAQAQADASSAPLDDPQAAIDALLAENGLGDPMPSSIDLEDPQAAIDAMLEANGLGDTPAPAKTQEKAPEKLTEKVPEKPSLRLVEKTVEKAEDEDPLAGLMDPDKVLAEVASLEISENDGPALEDALDTDKLLAEVGSFGATSDDSSLEDDLLAEFKDK